MIGSLLTSGAMPISYMRSLGSLLTSGAMPISYMRSKVPMAKGKFKVELSQWDVTML